MKIAVLCLALLVWTCTACENTPPLDHDRPGDPRRVQQVTNQIRNTWWCGDNGTRFVVEVVNTWNSGTSHPTSNPPGPVLPPNTPLPEPAIQWNGSSIGGVPWFRNIGVRNSLWGDATAEELGDKLQENVRPWPGSNWKFVNWSRPNQGDFTDGEEVGLWFYQWDTNTFSLGEIRLSRPLPDSRFLSPRETFIGNRRSLGGGTGSWSQSVRATCLNTSQLTTTTLGNGSGYSDDVRARNVAIMRSTDCWTCFNY